MAPWVKAPATRLGNLSSISRIKLIPDHHTGCMGMCANMPMHAHTVKIKQ